MKIDKNKTKEDPRGVSSPHPVTCGEGDIHQRRVFRNGEGGKSGNRECKELAETCLKENGIGHLLR